MKRGISLLFALLLLFSLCACSGDSNTSKSTDVTVVCKDENGSPVAGAKIQLCTENSCFMSDSNEKGLAVFNMAPDEYEIHVYRVPEGYLEPAESVVNTTAQDTEIEFVFPCA